MTTDNLNDKGDKVPQTVQFSDIYQQRFPALIKAIFYSGIFLMFASAVMTVSYKGWSFDAFVVGFFNVFIMMLTFVAFAAGFIGGLPLIMLLEKYARFLMKGRIIYGLSCVLFAYLIGVATVSILIQQIGAASFYLGGYGAILGFAYFLLTQKDIFSGKSAEKQVFPLDNEG